MWFTCEMPFTGSPPWLLTLFREVLETWGEKTWFSEVGHWSLRMDFQESSQALLPAQVLCFLAGIMREAAALP